MKVEDQQSLCPLCQGALRADDFALSFLRCQKCRLLVRNSSFKDEELHNLYRSSWFDPFGNLDETGGTNLLLAREYASHLLASSNLRSFEGMKILDFGAGRGDMMQALLEKGAEVVAVEPYGYDYLKARQHNVFHNLEEITGDIKFDGIVSLDVVEHLPAPWETLSTLKGYLAEHGWIFISTPNSDSLNARVFKQRWREALRPGHLFLFNPDSIQEMIAKVDVLRFTKSTWKVRYSSNPVVQAKDWFLRNTHLDGELRYFLYNQ